MSKGSKPARNHHYVPQFYLRNFTNAAGTLYGYNKKDQEHFGPRNPKTVAKEKDFYRDIGEGAKAELETRLGKFENQLAPAIKRILAKVNLSVAGLPGPPAIDPDDKELLAQFVALQMIRTPQTLERMIQIASDYVSPEDRVRLKELAKGAFVGTINQHLDEELDTFSQVINRHRLMFLIAAKDTSFWTNDAPVFVAKGSDDGKAYWHGIGIGDESLELYLPISSKVIAVFVGMHLDKVPPYFRLAADQVAYRNRLTYLSAHELVFGAATIEPIPVT